MGVINQLTQFMGITKAETFLRHSSSICSRPICWHSSASYALSSFLSLLFFPTAEQLAGAFQQLPLLLLHLDGVNGVIGGDLLDLLAATDPPPWRPWP
jgi:hypothetical protein